MVGLSFKKLDLHVHTPASDDFNNRDDIEPKDIVDEAIRKGLDGIAITDHNSGEWIDLVKEAAEGTGLTVFPGVEITCMGGKTNIHIIALFDTIYGTDHIKGVLSKLDLPPNQHGDPNAFIKKTPIDVIDVVTNEVWNGVAILAHANSSSGVLHDMRGNPRTAIIQHPNLSGAEATDFQNEDKRKQEKRVVDLLDGNDPQYQRKLAVYQASDNRCEGEKEGHCLEGIGSRYSYFKLEKVHFDGLYQCLMDPDVRIRQDFELAHQNFAAIKSIEMVGGFLDGQKVNFHDGLNSILGSKGSGKSLLVELLRFGLGQPPTQLRLLDDHEGKLLNRLGEYSYVVITFLDENGEEFKVKRTYTPFDNSPFEVEYDPALIMPVLFLSQNEIIRIAENEEDQLRFIDRFFNFRQYKIQIKKIEDRLSSLDKQMADGIRSMAKIEELKELISSAKIDVESIDKKLQSDIFREYRIAREKDQVLTRQEEHIHALDGVIASAYNKIDDVELPQIPDELDADPALRRNQDGLIKARGLIEQQISQVSKQLNGYEAQVERERQQWQPTFDEIKDKYQEHIRNVGGDHTALASERERKVKYIETLEIELAKHKKKQDQLSDVADERNRLLDNLEDIYSQYTEQRKSRSQQFQRSSEGKLRLEILGSNNSDEFRQRLLELKQGSYLRESEIDTICNSIQPREFIRALLRYTYAMYQKKKDAHKELDEIASLAKTSMKNMVALANVLTDRIDPEQLLELQYRAAPKDRPKISFNIGNKQFRPLKEVSVGQKSTALLIMALSDGTMPIVIDQPEDSLDIRSIWEDICKKLRIGKEHRQFIFTTHNSSVAVASDSDYFIILNATSDKGEVLFSGSMDHEPVSEEVLKYLEGGVETYRRKYTKYRAERRLNNLK